MELCDKVISENPFLLKHCPDKFITQDICDKAVESCLSALKFVPDWFCTSKMIEKLDSAVFPDDDIIFGDLDSDFVIFFSEDFGPNTVILDNIILDDEYFDYCDPETINHVRLMGWYNKYK